MSGAHLKGKMSLDSSGVKAGIDRAQKAVSSGLARIKKAGIAVFAALAVSAGVFVYTMKKTFLFETLQTQIKVLVGTAKEAKKVFNELKEFSAKTPFELPGIIEAWQQLKTFTEGALNTKEGLELVGDAAAARGKDFAEVAFWTGRMYSALKNGNPFLDSVGAMERMGIVGGKVRGTLTELEKSGASFERKWAVVEGSMLKFTGGMKELSLTGSGLISTLKDNWTIAVATFGEAFKTLAKDQIQGAIDHIRKLTEDGTIERWAEQAKGALDAILETIRLIKNEGSRTEVLQALGGVIRAAFVDAASASVSVLAKYAPTIGAALGRAAYDVIKGVAGDKPEALKRTREEFGIGTKEMGSLSSLFLENSPAFKKALKSNKAAIQKERIEKQGLELEDTFKDLGETLSPAMAEFQAVLKKQGEQFPKAANAAATEAAWGFNKAGGTVSSAGSRAAGKINGAGDEVADSIRSMGDKASDAAKDRLDRASPVGAFGNQFLNLVGLIFKKGSGKEGWQREIVENEKKLLGTRLSWAELHEDLFNVSAQSARNKYSAGVKNLNLITNALNEQYSGSAGGDGRTDSLVRALEKFSAEFSHSGVVGAVRAGYTPDLQKEQTNLLRQIRNATEAQNV